MYGSLRRVMLSGGVAGSARMVPSEMLARLPRRALSVGVARSLMMVPSGMTAR